MLIDSGFFEILGYGVFRKERFQMIPKRLISFVVFLLLTIYPLYADDVEEIFLSIKGGHIFELINTLTSEDMGGRLSGTHGYDRAARFAASMYEKWGLTPVYGDSFLQPFHMAYNEMRETHFSLIYPPDPGKEGKPTTKKMTIYEDFCPTLYSGFGQVEAEVVFAGFGLTAPELGWDDYGGVDVNGKIVATLRGTPQIPGKNFSAYAERTAKLTNAKKHGASGMILINRAVVSGAGVYVENLPMVMVGNEVANELFKNKGYDVQNLSALLRDGHHLSFPTGIRAEIDAKGAHHANAKTYNVVGLIEGSDPVLKDEYMIFGAHLDHLGPWPVIHPGASDNASGSTIVMELAYAFSRLKPKPKRSLIFALFGAEELGLLGSKHMAANLPEYPSKPIMMVNIDVAGAGTRIRVAGGKTYPELYGLIREVNDKYDINPNIEAGEISPVGGNSDYAPFLAKGIPAYTNSSGGGQRFGIHTAGDSIYIVTPKIMEDMARLYFMASYLYANK
jgi:hypothetical protein